MEYYYRLGITFVICFIYSHFSNYFWDRLVNDSEISGLLNTVGSNFGENRLNFKTHNNNYIHNSGFDKAMNVGHKLFGSNYVSKDSIDNYVSGLRQISPNNIDVTRVAPELQTKYGLKESMYPYDYSQISINKSECNKRNLRGCFTKSSIDIGNDLNKDVVVNPVIGGTNYRKVKKKIKKSGGGFVEKLESGLSPKNPMKLILYWLLMLLIMCLLAVISIIGVNSYAEITQACASDKNDTILKKIKCIGEKLWDYITDKLWDYLQGNWYKIFIPFATYCGGRLFYDFIYYDGVFIPVLGDIGEVIEHIPFLWTAGFAIYVFSTYYSLLSMADVKKCGKDNKSDMKRCIPSFKEACETDPTSSTCWFKI